MVILQGLVVYHVDDWHHEGQGVLLDPGEERLQPARVALAVAVQEEDHVPTGGPGTRQPGPDESLPLAEPHEPHLAGQEPVYVPLQLALNTHVTCHSGPGSVTHLEVGLVTEVVHQNYLLDEVTR